MNIINSLNLFDLKLSQNIIYLRSDFLNNFFVFFTKLGEWQIILGILFIICIFFYFNNKKGLILPFFATVLVSGGLALILKHFVDRIRPGTDISLFSETGASFPSAHAALIFALFGFLIYCFWQFNAALRIKISVSIVFALIIFLVGFSRLYLGVHYLSDVLAGYLIGLICILLTISFPRKKFSLLSDYWF
jgi:membrane-associated phospholipid phosphatase